MTDDEKQEAGKNLLIVLGVPVFVSLLTSVVLILSIPFQVFYAWVFQKLWIWFVVPLHAPAINLWMAWGIMLVWRYFNYNRTSDKSEGWKETAGSIIVQIFFALTTLLIGYFIKGHIRVNW